MPYLETIISFAVGLSVASLLAVIFSLKTRGFARLFINVAAGITALLILSLFKVPPFTFNPLSAFMVGVLGVPALFIIYIIVMFL